MDMQQRLAAYIKAADTGNWNHCRAICNHMGCGLEQPVPRTPGLTFMERQMWGKLFKLACSTRGDRDWPKVRAELGI